MGQSFGSFILIYAPCCYSGDPLERGGGACNGFGLGVSYAIVWLHWTLGRVEPSLSVNDLEVLAGGWSTCWRWEGVPRLCVAVLCAAIALGATTTSKECGVSH